jgi:hypothetical protein
MISRLSEHEKEARFEVLQRRLANLWKTFHMGHKDEQTTVVVPSLSMNLEWGPALIQAYEERFLFLLFLLRQPRMRLIYVTSQNISPEIIDYYLNLLPGVIASHARRRLFLVAPCDGSPKPLTEKLLSRPRLLEKIRSLILNPNLAHLVPYNTTDRERDLALRLGIPMYGADPKFFHYGTKSGCRKLFREEDVPHALGREDLFGLDDVVSAIAGMRVQKPGLARVLVKLNDAVSGEGNAAVDLADLPDPGAPGERGALESRLRQMRFELIGETFDGYFAKLKRSGGVVEERLAGSEFRSPSVQMRITPLGDVELLSTHDQLLGGPSGQSYLGARFPADIAYAASITREGAKIGNRLARQGVLGRFAVDFVVVRSSGEAWRPYAVEVNLRKGGTTHPFLTLQFLTDGKYHPEQAQFVSPSGRTKYFVASDHVESPLYRALTLEDLFDMITVHGLHFDQARQTGVVLHMMSALSEHGRIGLTAVGDSPEEADNFYKRMVHRLNEAAEDAMRDRGWAEP